ncbi:MAG: M28 family peptidase, partial [Puniceicoccales bacterium]
PFVNTLKRVGLLFLFLLGLPLFLIWIAIAQPSLHQNQPSSVKVPPESLEDHVRALSETFFPRNFQNTRNLNRAADYIADHFRNAGASVHFQEYEVGGRTYRNVIGTFGTLRGERVIIGAHYDSHHKTPGADDNASGVAGLIELAALIGKSPLQNQNLELVAYTLEEPPFFDTEDMGSYRHAQALFRNEVKVRGMIALEMIGYFSDEPGSQSYPSSALKLLYPDTGNFIGVIGKLSQREFTRQIKEGMKGVTDLPVYSLNAPEALPGVDYSDHRNYWIFGYDAIMISDTAFYRNPHYHEASDTSETLDYARMAKVVASLFESLQSLPLNPADNEH